MKINQRTKSEYGKSKYELLTQAIVIIDKGSIDLTPKN